MPHEHDAERRPVDPGPCRYHLPAPDEIEGEELVGVGGDLEPSTLIAAYRSGLFPMPLRRRTIGWWSPDPRGILPLDGLVVSRSLRRSCARYTTTRDQCFERVVRACGDARREHGWINDDIVRAYTRLHELGWAHSVETWLDDQLVGGLYGIRIGRFFAGESMFSTANDASKVALIHLVGWLRDTGAELLDVQWQTPHLSTLGVIAVPRHDYLRLLAAALADRPAGSRRAAGA